MAVMRCPNCGKPNPDFLEVCQYCDAKLHPEGGAPTAPGAPASAEDTLIRPPAPRAPTPGTEPEPDAERDAQPLGWMDRLRQMQSGEAPPAAVAKADEPDWMWTGELSEAPKSKDAPAAPPAGQDSPAELPEWLRDLDEPINLKAEQPQTTVAPASPITTRSGQLPITTSPAPPAPPITNYKLPITAPEQINPPTPPTRTPPTQSRPEPSPFEPTASDVTIPPRPRRKLTDWLNKLHELPPPSGPAEPEQTVTSNTDADLPDWLKAVAADAASSGGSGPAIEAATPSMTTPAAAPTPEEELPDWLRALRGKSQATTPVPGTGALQTRPPAGTGGLTGRRDQALPESMRPPAPDDTLIPQPGAKPLEPASDDVPDWLRSILSVHTQDAATGTSEAASTPAAPAAAEDQAADSAALGPLIGPAADAVWTSPPAQATALAQAAPAIPDFTPTAAVTPPATGTPPATPQASASDVAAIAATTAEASQPASITNYQAEQPTTTAPAIDDALPPPTRRGKHMTDWLGSVPAPIPSTAPVEDELPDWLKSLSAESAANEALAEQAPAGSATPAAEELPDWLKAMAPDKAAQAQPSAEPTPAAEPAAPVTNFDAERPITAAVPAAPITTQSGQLPGTTPEPAARADDLPDWLKAITRAEVAEPPATTPLSPPPEPAEPITTLGGPLPSTTPEPVVPADDLPDWLKAITRPEVAEPPATTPLTPTPEPAAPITTPSGQLPLAAAQPAAPADELPDWLKAITQASETAATAAVTTAGAEAETTIVPGQAEAPAAAIAFGAPAAEAPAATTPETAAAEPATTPQTPAATVAMPPWLVGVGTGPLPELPALDEETLAWLSESQKTAPAPAGLDLGAAKLPPEKPAWLDELAAATSAAPTPAAAPEIAPTPEEEMPEWLRAMRGQTGEEEGAPEAMPDWLRALRGLPPGAQAGGAARPATQPAPGAATTTAATALVGAPTSAAATSAAPTVGAPTTASSGLEQASLPAWLAGMRPVDIAQPEASEADSYQETLGVLAGMRGVLRAEPVVAQPHKATTPVHNLTVSETNTAQANLLAGLLITETAAQPARRGRVRMSTLAERWVVFLVLLVALLLAQFQAELKLPAIFAAPSPNLPPEAAAVYSLIEGLPKDKPALVAFDYDAAQSGELDPGAQAVIGHLAHHGLPVVGVSLRLTGPAVAQKVLEQQFNVPGQRITVDFPYGNQYLNLGFIPGGPVGLLQFASDPRSMFDVDFTGVYSNSTVWDKTMLIKVHTLSDFGLIVLVSGAPESTRAWIEQAQSFAAGVPTVAVISAVAEPMVRPYYDDPAANSLMKGHLPLKGLIVGLGGAAAYERATSSPAAATTLWPALGGGLLAAAAIIVLGNLFFVVFGALRRRRA